MGFDTHNPLRRETFVYPLTPLPRQRVRSIGAEAEWRETVRFWKSCGATHLTLGTYSGRGHLRRIEGRTLADHLAAIKRYWNAVADLL